MLVYIEIERLHSRNERADIAVCNVGNIQKRLRNDYFVDFLINDFRKATKSPAAGVSALNEGRSDRTFLPPVPLVALLHFRISVCG